MAQPGNPRPRFARTRKISNGELHMAADKLRQFEDQKYLNIESFRKDGRSVITPVWFAQSGGRFYVYSEAGAGKVKRIRNNPKVRVAPCDFRGKVTGEWVDASAKLETGDAEEQAERLLTQKYGWMKRIGDFFARLRKHRHAIISIGLE